MKHTFCDKLNEIIGTHYLFHYTYVNQGLHQWYFYFITIYDDDYPDINVYV